MDRISRNIENETLFALEARERSAERFKRIFWTAASATVAKGVNTLTMLVSVPIMLGYLGNERYGLLATITSVISFLAFADLGVGNVILNLISKAHGQDDAERAREYISSAAYVLTWISAGFLIAFWFVYPLIRWGEVFNVSSPLAKEESGPAIAVFIVCFLVNLPLSIVPRVQMGYQRGYINGIWDGMANLLGLAGLVTIVYLKAGLPWVTFIIGATPIASNLLNAVTFFFGQRPWLMPRYRDITGAASRYIISHGFLFFLLQISNVVICYSDNLIIAKVIGAEAVTNYAVPVKMFSILSASIYMVLGPMWPAYGEAKERGDEIWMRRVLIRTIVLSFSLSMLASLVLLFFGEKILYVWVGSRVAFSFPLMLAFAAWTTLSSVLASIGIFLNATNKIGMQTTFALTASLLAIGLKIILAEHIGVPGVVWANVFACTCLMLIPYTIYLRIIARRVANLV